MADLTNQKQLENIVLIIKNGSASGWASTSYRLAKGELGICYLDNGNIIVKAGVDGNTAWADLPQVEGVFESDLTLTYAFGKYSPDTTGSYTLRTAGKTMSEVMLDAYSQEVFTDLITGRPSASIEISGGKSNEVGNTYSNDVTVTLTINPTGTYKYGAKDAEGNKEQADIAFTSANIRQDSSTATPIKTLADVSDNKITYTLDVSESILGDTSVTYTFYGDAAYGADANRPLTNLGNLFKAVDGGYEATKVFSEATGQIAAGTALSSTKKTVTYSGYRKMFFGLSNADNPTVDSDFVRGLNTISEKAAKTTKTFTATAGTKSFYVAIPNSLTTTMPTFNYKFFGEWKTLSGVSTVGNNINVEGHNGYTAKPYTVYKYTPESGSFDADTEIQVIIK